MPMSSSEARQTLQALDDLISVAELLNLDSAQQRAALHALIGRRAALENLLASREALAAEKVVALSAWRDGSDEIATQRRRRNGVAATALRL